MNLDDKKSEKKLRICLRCRQKFMSQHVGNRMCPNCKGEHARGADHKTDLDARRGVPRLTGGFWI